MTTPDERWLDDSIQFPRLLCELIANCEFAPGDFDALCESMDLTPSDINELFDRAHVAWERAKLRVSEPTRGTLPT